MKSIKKQIIFNFATGMTIAIIFISGCKKFIAIPSPATKVVTANVFSNNTTATAAILNIYYGMDTQNVDSYFLAEITGLLSDELTGYSTSGSQQDYYVNAMNSTTDGSQFWIHTYNYIYQANAIIAGLQSNSGVSPAVKQQLTGEAYFARAFWHLYLANLYGDVPLALTTDYTVTSKLSRTPQKDVYQQVIADLKTAQSLLNANYVDASDTTITTEKVRPTKSVAEALLARVYLYTGDYQDAQAAATQVINNTSLYSLDTDPNNVFLKNSSEAIWQLQTTTPLSSNGAVYDGTGFILTGAPSTGNSSTNSSAISPQLLAAFESGDTRKTKWISSITVGGTPYYFPFKYKYNSTTAGGNEYEYTMVLRLAEQYLIRAEAEAQLNDLADATKDLNTIRTRAGLPNTTATTQTGLLTAIQHERQVELFTEWGNRWFDLKRTGILNSVMGVVTPQKGGIWYSDGHQALMPIPITDVSADPNLTQNAGY